MEVLEAIRGRRSTRAYLDKPVAKQTIIDVLEAARWAPSGVNTQPWKVIAIGPSIIEPLGEAIINAREAGTAENPDYNYYPNEWVEPYKSRRKACGLALYSAVGIAKEDTAKRKEAWYRNYVFFQAPVGLLFFIDARMDKGSWVDMGMFIQSVMLAARGHGLETCPEASMAEFPDIVRKYVGLDKSYSLICGMAMGYADASAAINNYRTERETVESFVTFFD